jgi:hypothetical protein
MRQEEEGCLGLGETQLLPFPPLQPPATEGEETVAAAAKAMQATIPAGNTAIRAAATLTSGVHALPLAHWPASPPSTSLPPDQRPCKGAETTCYATCANNRAAVFAKGRAIPQLDGYNVSHRSKLETSHTSTPTEYPPAPIPMPPL